MSEVGEKIKYLRQISKMSQEELGLRVGVQRAAINKYEKGLVRNIPIATIEKIAEIFEVSPGFLLGWDESLSEPLSAEVKVLNGVQRFYGSDAVKLLESYVSLNKEGKERLLRCIEVLELAYLPKDANL